MKRAYRLQLLLGLLGVLAATPTPSFADTEETIEEIQPHRAGLISLTLVDSDIRDALRMVALQGNVNIVMSKSVQGKISLNLSNVSLSESLDAIVRVGGYQYTIDNNIVTVATLEEQRQQQQLLRELQTPYSAPEIPEVLVLTLRYIDAERIRPIVQNLLSESGTVTLLETSDHIAKNYSSSNYSRSNNSSNNRNTRSGTASSALQLGSDLSTSSQGRPAKSHTLVVMDFPEHLKRVERVVSDIDVMPVSIVIEARFVEISLDEENRMGIDWNAVASLSGAASPTTFPFGDLGLGPFNPNVAGGSPQGLFPEAPNSVTVPGSDGLFTFGSLDFSAFSAVLEMIERESRVQVVSNPRIVVNDRHTATILVGERYPILSANISEFGTVTEQLDRYEPVGVQLIVTPSVLSEDEIELFVRPTSSSIGSIVEGSSGLQVARINSRQIDTAVTVKDGQTVVLGGLITTRETLVETSVPFLGTIPFLGRLFSHENTRLERIDLVVFLTVRIVRKPGLTEAQRRLFEQTTPSEGDPLAPTGPKSALGYNGSPAEF